MHIGSEKIRVLRVLRNVRENSSIHSLYFRDERCAAAAKPGQFVMVWEPGLDEMPMSLSGYGSDGLCSVTVKPWGPGSTELARAKRGSLMGIRGPYGRAFTVERCTALLVGGGTGLAPLLPLARELVDAGSAVTAIIGGRTRTELLFERAMSRVVRNRNLFVATDDGSRGFAGFPTRLAERLVGERRVERIYTCGPEAMMKGLYDLAEARGVEIEASLERNMKCGIGICGSCVVGKYLLCRDGPVLDGMELSRVLDEFGLLQRDHSGNYVKV